MVDVLVLTRHMAVVLFAVSRLDLKNSSFHLLVDLPVYFNGKLV